MGKVITGVQAWWAEYDVSGDGNAVEPTADLPVLESRPFNSAFVRKDPGLPSDSVQFRGYLSNNDPSVALMQRRAARVPMTVAINRLPPALELDDCYLAYGIHNLETFPVTQGELWQFQAMLAADDLIGFGAILANGQKTASGASAAGYDAGPVADGQSIVASLHVPLAVSGTIDAVVESAAAGDPTFSSPTTRLTFSQVGTTPTSEWVRDKPAGGITDTLWRLSWTGAASPDHTIAAGFAIV